MALETFNDFCKNLYQCAEKLEEELETNINTSEDLIVKSETVDVKLPLQKVKVYHYNEIVKLLENIKIDIKKILYHEQCVSKLESTRKLSGEDREFYASSESLNLEKPDYKQNFTRREKRRVASEVSLYTLSTWEAYLKKKEEEEATVPEISVKKFNVPKRNQPRSKRKQKKFVSSTFNDILEDDDVSESGNISKCNSIVEEIEDVGEETDRMDWTKKFLSFSENDLTFEESKVKIEDTGVSCMELRMDVSRNSEDTKPKIVDILYKKQPDPHLLYDLQSTTSHENSG